MKPGNYTPKAAILFLAAIFGVLFFMPRMSDLALRTDFTGTPVTQAMLQSVTRTPFQPLTNSPTHTASATPSRTPKPSRTPSLPSTFTLTATFSPSPTPTPLDKAAIQGIRGRWAAYNLDCETRSAVDWAAYFGVQIDEIEFYNALPVSDNPDQGFVGDVNAPWGSLPPEPYGVHAKPVAALLRDYGLPARAVRYLAWDQLRSEISQGRPVIVWVVGRVGRGTPVAYTAASGHETTVARFEHTVILTGYSKTEVTVLDGYWVYTRLVQDFLASWSVLGNMAIIWDGTYPLEAGN